MSFSLRYGVAFRGLRFGHHVSERNASTFHVSAAAKEMSLFYLRTCTPLKATPWSTAWAWCTQNQMCTCPRGCRGPWRPWQAAALQWHKGGRGGMQQNGQRLVPLAERSLDTTVPLTPLSSCESTLTFLFLEPWNPPATSCGFLQCTPRKVKFSAGKCIFSQENSFFCSFALLGCKVISCSIPINYRQTFSLGEINCQLQTQNRAARTINFHYRDRSLEISSESFASQIQILSWFLMIFHQRYRLWARNKVIRRTMPGSSRGPYYQRDLPM